MLNNKPVVKFLNKLTTLIINYINYIPSGSSYSAAKCLVHILP